VADVTVNVNGIRGESKTIGAGGLGFRYRLARKPGLRAGVDLTRGPEDTSIYLTEGSAWNFQASSKVLPL
jgi:hypothetical protein